MVTLKQDSRLVKYTAIHGSRDDVEKSLVASALREVPSRERLTWVVSLAPKYCSPVAKNRANIIKRNCLGRRAKSALDACFKDSAARFTVLVELRTLAMKLCGCETRGLG